jgi:hypothetical protein
MMSECCSTPRVRESLTGPLKASLAAIRPLIRAPCCLANSPAGAFRKAPSTSAALAPPMGCRATRESAQWGPDGPRTGCRCSGSTPITHTEAVEPSADPSRWRCGRAGFQTGGVENQILKLAVWKLQKSVGGVEAANWRCRNFNPVVDITGFVVHMCMVKPMPAARAHAVRA